ncbi:restin homolog [Symsagittifera roscoffensis]|uniref:restin homolog n=1 Tax=Symsagittifera roscoffensis TaxID=84072 RepID=UPI00307B66A5
MISDSFIDKMEKKLNDLQSRQKQHDLTRRPDIGAQSSFSAVPKYPQSPVGADSTRKYSDLQKQMDQMLGMVRSETENVRSLESQLHNRGVSGTSGPQMPPPPATMTMPKFEAPPVQPQVTFQAPSGSASRAFGGMGGSMPQLNSVHMQPSMPTFGMNSKDFERQLSSLLTRSRTGANGDGNSEIKSELEAVITGLTDYLNHMRHELERLRKENERLKIQLAEQQVKFHDSENEKQAIANEKHELEKIQDQARELMAKLQNTERSNEDLRRELEKYPNFQSLEQMKQSERELHALKSTAAQQKEDFHAERENLASQLKNEKRKSEELQRRLYEMEKLDKEYNNLQIQFASIQATKDSLREQLNNAQHDLKVHIDSALKPEDLLRHIQEMTLNVERQSGDLVPYHEHDLAGKALSDLQKVLNGKFSENKREMENLQNLINSLQQDNKEMDESLRNEQERHRKTKEYSQTQRQQDKHQFDEKVKQWQDEIRKVKERSEVDREQYEQELHRLDAERRELESTIRELEKNHLRKELAESEKFHRLQNEVADLKDIVKTTNDSHNNQVMGYEKQLSDYEHKLEAKEIKCHDLDKTCGLLERDLTKCQLEAEQLQRQVSDLNEKLTHEQRVCDKHQDAIENLKNEEAKLKSVIKVQKEDISKLSQLFEKALEGGIHNEEVGKLTLEVGNLQAYITGQDETIRKMAEDLRKAELAAQQPRFIKDSDSGEVVRTDDTNAGLYCNVLEHHKLEDYLAVLKNKLEKTSKGKKIDTSLKRQTKELDNVLSQLDKSKAELEQIDDQFKNVNKKYKATVERIEQFQRALSGVTLNPDILDYFNGKGNSLLPREVAEALHKHDRVKEELQTTEENLIERKQELEVAEHKLKEIETQSTTVEERTKSVMKVYSETKKQLNKSQSQAKKLIQQMTATSSELNQASSALNSLKGEVEILEKKKSEAEADLKDINKIIAKKNDEFHTVEQKRLRAKESADDIRSTEDELFGHLKASEKALIERKNELQMLETQAQEEARSIQEIETEIIRKKSELQSVKDELSSKQAELTVVLKEAEDNMNKKTRELKDSKADLDTLQVEMNEYDSLKNEKRRELNEIREALNSEENNHRNLQDSISTSSKELKQLREMIGKEKAELDSLRNDRNDLLSTNINLDF